MFLVRLDFDFDSSHRLRAVQFPTTHQSIFDFNPTKWNEIVERFVTKRSEKKSDEKRMWKILNEYKKIFSAEDYSCSQLCRFARLGIEIAID